MPILLQSPKLPGAKKNPTDDRNINLGGDTGINHMAIDKNPRIQAEIERAIVSVPQPQAQVEAQAR